MKKIILFFFLLVGIGNTFGQKILSTTGTSQFFLPEIENPYGPNDQIDFEFFATNNTDNHLFINPSFQLLDGTEAIYSWVPSSEILSEQFTEGNIVFQFPDNCTIPNGEYQLRFVVNYSQPTDATSPVTYTTKDGDLNTICNNQDIPAEAPYTSADCEVFVLTVVFENEGPCCFLDPEITLTAEPFFPSHPWKSCKWWVRTNIDWGGSAPVQFNVMWNTGDNGTNLLHLCGTTDYSVTINWLEDGEWCSKESETITVESRCYCIYEYPIIRQLPIGTTNGLVESIVLHPNPSDGHFHLQFPENQIAISLEIWNTTGSKILEQTGAFENSVPIDLGSVEAGTYLLKVQYEDGTFESAQFLVQ
jgi:hypothetical protein